MVSALRVLLGHAIDSINAFNAAFGVMFGAGYFIHGFIIATELDPFNAQL